MQQNLRITPTTMPKEQVFPKPYTQPPQQKTSTQPIVTTVLVCIIFTILAVFGIHILHLGQIQNLQQENSALQAENTVLIEENTILRNELSKAVSPGTLEGIKNDVDRIGEILNPHLPSEEKQNRIKTNFFNLLKDIFSKEEATPVPLPAPEPVAPAPQG